MSDNSDFYWLNIFFIVIMGILGFLVVDSRSRVLEIMLFVVAIIWVATLMLRLIPPWNDTK